MSDRPRSATDGPDRPERVHLVTGKLAAAALAAEADRIAARRPVAFTIDVLPITVAALMTGDWIARRIAVPPGTDRVIVPGYVAGDLTALRAACPCPVEVGPKDLRRLGECFGATTGRPAGYGRRSIEIVAEINHCPRRPLAEIVAIAGRMRAAGADRIDVGCEPGGVWAGLAECVRELVDSGHRVSVDSLCVEEIAAACDAGADLVLSVNGTNGHAAADWGAEVVVIPDDVKTLAGFDATIERLAAGGVPMRLDPILEPIGMGFAASLGRYLETRRRHPDAAMLMGIGNLTELTDVDSAGVNALLLGFCQELCIGSVLTTEVAPWCRSSVAECRIAGELVHYAVTEGVPPKSLDDRLIRLRDARPVEPTAAELDVLAAAIRDPNYRLFVSGGDLHAVTAGLHLSHADPFTLFDRLLARRTRPLDPSHAYYLGYEACKAITAATLGKQYTQDEALRWGDLTRAEVSHRGGGEGGAGG